MRVVALVLLLAGCAPPVAVSTEAVVYGADDRLEPYEHPNAALRAVAATSIAMQIDDGWLDETDPENVLVTYEQTLGEAQELCAGERFADQIEPGTCSGTLVADRYVLTAGHCVADPGDCDGDDAWLFGFRYVSTGTLATFTADDVYHCARVLAYRDDGEADHAVVELDRVVVGHLPASTGARRVWAPFPTVGSELHLIGHPNGIPMKIASGGRVTSTDTLTLTATLDAFSGNSGSGVFDASGRIVAILTSGDEDYAASGGCNVVNVIDPPPEGDGEGLTYVGAAMDTFCAAVPAAAPCDLSASTDAGGSSDAGVVAIPDAGSTTTDAGSAATDAGEVPPPAASGCGCRASATPPRSIELVAVLVALAVARRSRSMRRAVGLTGSARA